MATLSVLTWIGNAAAVLTGPWGAVTAQTQQANCSRQAAYTHAQRVQQAVTEAQTAGPSRAQLRADCERLQQENRQLWEAWADSVTCGPPQQRHFAATAAALGLSLNQTRALLACVLPPSACPSRATLDRWVADAAARASQVLATLDRACQPLVQTLCLDEIFCHRRPVLMGVEPHSLAWVLGQRGPDRSGATWQKALQPGRTCSTSRPTTARGCNSVWSVSSRNGSRPPAAGLWKWRSMSSTRGGKEARRCAATGRPRNRSGRKPSKRIGTWPGPDGAARIVGATPSGRGGPGSARSKRFTAPVVARPPGSGPVKP